MSVKFINTRDNNMVKTVTSPKLVALLDEDPLWEREQKPEKVVSVKKTSKKDKKK